MSSKLQKQRVKVAQGHEVTYAETLLTPKSLRYVPSILAVEGSLGRKLSDYIHHIYLAAPLWQTLV